MPPEFEDACLYCFEIAINNRNIFGFSCGHDEVLSNHVEFPMCCKYHLRTRYQLGTKKECSMLPVTSLTAQDGKLCPIRNVLAKVTGKWQTLIVLALEDGALRFGELKRTIGDITQRVLTENLRSLERDGYLTRTVDPGPPVAVSYALTPLGRELLNASKHMVNFALESFPKVMAARDAYDS